VLQCDGLPGDQSGQGQLHLPDPGAGFRSARNLRNAISDGDELSVLGQRHHVRLPQHTDRHGLQHPCRIQRHLRTDRPILWRLFGSQLVRLLGNLHCNPAGLVPCFGLLYHSGAPLFEAALTDSIRHGSSK